MPLQADDDERPADMSAATLAEKRGHLLSGEGLVRAIREPNRIFRTDTWSTRQIRGAGYDVRLAGDLLVIPTMPGEAGYRVIDSTCPEVPEFTLAPGDSALISTIEKFCFDFDVAATLGPKFSLSARGLLMLEGTAVHPGYGRTRGESGEWYPKEDERLYFVVANVGPDNIVMRKGDTIAHLQIFDIEPPKERQAAPNQGFALLRERLFTSRDLKSDGEVVYFRNIQDLRLEVRKLDADRASEWQELRQNTEHTIADLRQKVDEAQAAVDRVSNASSMIIVFGVFLVSAALFGFVLTALADLIERLPAHISTDRTILVAILAILYGVGSIAGVVLVTMAVRSLVSSTTRRGPAAPRD